MTPFTTLDAVAAPLDLQNVDTDRILPAAFMKTIRRTGLARGLFHAMRHEADGAAHARFVLDQPPWTEAEILVTGANFGGGSSREHAPWSLLDFGIRCLIGPSFADIFYANCLKNGMLPAIVAPADGQALMATAVGAEPRLRVDLIARTITARSGHTYGFAIEDGARKALLSGEDEIARTLAREADITHWEAAQVDF